MGMGIMEKNMETTISGCDLVLILLFLSGAGRLLLSAHGIACRLKGYSKILRRLHVVEVKILALDCLKLVA